MWGRPSNRKLQAEWEQRAVAILSDPVYRGFGPTLAAEYLEQKHQLTVSRDTLRGWMRKAGLWKAGRRRVEQVHEWRPRRSRCGELVQWDAMPENRPDEARIVTIASPDSVAVGAMTVSC